jgi:hypothetical protein
MNFARKLALLVTSAALVACSAEAYYLTLQEQQKESCRKLLNNDDRNNCLKRTDKPYDAYKVDEEAARNGGKRAPAK